jgi:hypothetical protein
MSQAQTTKKQLLRKSVSRRSVGGLKSKVENPAESLFEFVRIIQNIPTDPETIAFNSKYMIAPDGSVVEY